MVVTPVFQTSNGRRALAFAVPVMRDGDVAYGLAAVYDTQLLAKALEMVAFEGKGLTSIIQADGTYVVRSMPYGEGADSGNFYAPGRMQFEDGYSLKQIKEEIARGKSGFFAFSTPGGMDHYAYYLPMGFNDWTVVTMADVYKRQR